MSNAQKKGRLTYTDHTMMTNDAVQYTTMRAFEIPTGGLALNGDQRLIVFLSIRCLPMGCEAFLVSCLILSDHHLLLVDY